jgi:hypothetical protein
VPYLSIKDVLTQQDSLRTRGKWVSKIQEYDLDIKPTKINMRQGLAKRLIKSNEDSIRMGESDKVNVILRELEHDEW